MESCCGFLEDEVVRLMMMNIRVALMEALDGGGPK